MHIIMALITALATLLFVLEKLGVDIGWFNPWAWSRRRRWLKQLHINPAFNLDSPMEAAALLLLATGRIDGDLSAEEKNELRTIFRETFKQSDEDASALLVSSTYLFGSGEDVIARPGEVLNRSLQKFTEEQKASTLRELKRIANTGGSPSTAQEKYIDQIEDILETKNKVEEWK